MKYQVELKPKAVKDLKRIPKEFLSVQEALGDFEDLKELRKEKEKSKSEPTTPLDEVTKNLGL